MYSDKNDLLTKAKDLLKEEMTNISYTTWIKNLEIESVNENKIILIAQSVTDAIVFKSDFSTILISQVLLVIKLNVFTTKSKNLDSIASFWIVDCAIKIIL